MRTVNINKLRNYQDDNCIKNKKIKYYEPMLYDIVLDSEKSKIDFVKKIEKIIRKSTEYRNFISFLKDYMDMDSCAYFHKINKKLKNVSIEIHHTPFTLYDIVYIVLEKHLQNDMEINKYYIANEVMKIHYEGLVGLYPLSITVHELVHEGEIYIPVSYVLGNICEFYKEYSIYMSDEQKMLLYKNIELSEQMKDVPDVLKKKYIYLDIDDESYTDEIDLPNI